MVLGATAWRCRDVGGLRGLQSWGKGYDNLDMSILSQPTNLTSFPDSGLARDAFNTFVPISADSSTRVQIIQDFFDLLAAVAAHGKANGLGGHKLSRYAGWWAFEQYDSGKGFESGYKSWARYDLHPVVLSSQMSNSYSAADAASHLFFAYLRSLSSSGKSSGILTLPRSLQQLLDSTSYPPRSGLLTNDTTKVVMIVDVVSPTPYALLRRAKNFHYRDDDHSLQQFASYEDPVGALTDECRRVLKAISSANQSHVSNANTSTSLTDPSWSRFEDIGFGSSMDDDEDEGEGLLGRKRIVTNKTHPASHGGYQDLARPTTPSWADFLSSGFTDENGNRTHVPMLLPPDKILPPINSSLPRGQSSQSHRRNLDVQQNLDPGELASITRVNVDDSFWWVWISSLASEEPTSRKAVFGRCALIETVIHDGQWMVMEEQVKGAAPEPAAGAYIAEKKTFLGFTTKRGRLTRRRSGTKKSPLSPEPQFGTNNRATLAPDQHAKIQQAAAELSKKKAAEDKEENSALAKRRGRQPDTVPASKTNSVFTIGPLIKDEASPALQWASQYDKKAIRAKYLGDTLAGKGSRELLTLPSNGGGLNRSASTLSVVSRNKDLPSPPENRSKRHLPERSQSAERPAVLPTPELAPLPLEPTEPAEATAIHEATEVPLPPETPDLSEPKAVKPPPAKLRKSTDTKRTSPDEKKNRGKQPGPPPAQQRSGIRRLFGRSKPQEVKVPEPVAPAGVKEEDDDPAILAARRALEGEPVDPSANPTSPPLSPAHFNRLATVPTATHNPEPPQTPPMAASVPHDSAPIQEEEEDLDLHREPTRQAPAPPRTHREEEYDQLSRVDTDEREHADREFSTFDQGPLLDQPAFVAPDTPPRSAFLTPAEELPRPPISIHSGRSYQRSESSRIEEEDEGASEAQPQINPQDRWAQIRKNAAERAARQEEPTTRSRTETRTDDGDTSGEESK